MIENIFSPFSPHRGPLDYLDMLLYRRKWVVRALLGFLVLSIIAYFITPDQYTSSTVVIMQSEEVPTELTDDTREASYIETDEAGTRIPTRLLTVPQEVVATPRLEQLLEELNPYPEYSGWSRALLVTMVRARTAVHIEEGDAFRIDYTDSEPARAQKIAAHLATIFIEEASGERARRTGVAADFLEKQIEETRQKLMEKEEALRTLKQRYMGMLPEQLTDNLAKLEQLNTDLGAATEAVQAAEAQKKLLERQLSVQLAMSDPSVQLVPELDAGGGPLQDLQTARAQLAVLRERYAEEHPEVRALAARIERLETEAGETASGEGGKGASGLSERDYIATELRAQIEGASQTVERAKQRETEIADQVTELQGRIAAIPRIEQEIQTLTRDTQSLAEYYNQLLSKGLQVRTAGAVESRWKGDQFRVVQPAQLPEVPVIPKAPLFLGAGIALGLLVGIGLVFVMEWFDHSVKDAEEAKALLRYPLLGSILHIPKKKPSHRWRPRPRFFARTSAESP